MDEKDEARDVTVYMQGVKVNLSPNEFHRYATHYYKCKRDFAPPDDKVSPVPYFLLCRAIELEIKAKHLKRLTLKEVEKFGHRLLKAYKALDAQEQILSQNELAVLKTADEPYRKTDFAYFNPDHAHPLMAYSQFPDLDMLDTITKKLIDSGSTNVGITPP
jgi:hypothetical protein